MMEKVVIPDTHTFHRFDPSINAIAEVELNHPVEIIAKDTLGNRIKSESEVVTSLTPEIANPTTGPIYVRGVRRGDALAVKILEIKPREEGFVYIVPGRGILQASEPKTVLCRYIDGEIEVKGVRLKAWKMVGTIGVATSEKTPTLFPGRHGGNIDTKAVTEGSTIYLPVEYDGALFGLGDVHSAMGDGEMATGCETAARVTVVFDVVEGKAPLWPVVDYLDSYYIVVSDDDIHKAFKEASEMSVRVLSHALNMDWYSAYSLATLAVDLEVSRRGSPRTVRARIPKHLVSIDKLLEALKREF
ncbi:MAG: acetamidase/formamidase family protein [Zestosphaera sp.]